MKTGRSLIISILLLPVFCMLLSGCEAEDNPYTKAAEAYAQGDYAAAEPYFIAAIESGDNRTEVVTGHAYNLMQLGRYADAISEFLSVQANLTSKSDVGRIKKTMLSAYLAEENYAGAARVCDELARDAADTKEATDYLIQAAEIRADMYESRNETEQLITELEKLIELKEYAGEEYIKIYYLEAQDPDLKKRLKTADDFIMYVTGHSAFVTDYIPVITLLFNAADAAGYSDHEHDREYYYTKAEEFMDLASEQGAGEEVILKFKIAIAERRGKTELAYKLLGVYLNHCPEDEMALKEKEYLENRLGFE